MVGVVVELLDVARIPFGTVVTGDDEERILELASLFQRIYDHANVGIDLGDEVAVLAGAAASDELLGGHPRPMRRWQREVKEEGLVGALGLAFDVVHRMPSQVGQHIEKVKALRRLAGSPEYGAIEAARLMHSGGLLTDVVFQVDIRGHVERSRNDIGVVEAECGRSVRNRRAEIDLQSLGLGKIGSPLECYRLIALVPAYGLRQRRPVQAEMPLTDDCGVVALLPQHAGDRHSVRLD